MKKQEDKINDNQKEKFDKMAEILGCYLYNPGFIVPNKKESEYGKIVEENNAFK